MENVRISIPEFDERGLTYEESFRIIVIMLNHELYYLKNLHPSEAIDDLDAYPLQVAQRIVNTAYTLHSIIERDKDYVVANIIVRSIADYISSFILIYNEADERKKVLRHYLYIIDGLQGRLNQLPENLFNDGQLVQAEYEALSKQIEEAKANYQAIYDFSIKQIRNLPNYSGHKAVIDKLIRKANWKFKSLTITNMDKNTLKWNDLYSYLNLKESSGFFSSLSEFVHGLSTSNLAFGKNNEIFEPVYSITISLMGKLREILDVVYSDDIKIIRPKMITALCDEGMPNHYVMDLLDSLKKSQRVKK
ncbi:hypothetical protein SAMN05216365_10757 [Porphyromonadaceae bacterium NLAE-zl-C104]|uniref:hypothetical protein n=1 Tax=Proteiniphilum saccharofermentans TaxID=1642647 RepID=UPI0008F12D83|nr:hypothetical protein [Proteiniphilum saccharofermentans]SFS46147.1 hypothetical protein SAMN05216365_10757 [Porphyromonadaceae bacterium NLAE-zl-C104]